MDKGFLGFSNLYLKAGGLLLVASFAALAYVALVPSPGSSAIHAAGYLFASGLTLYAIGRLAQLVRSCRRA